METSDRMTETRRRHSRWNRTDWIAVFLLFGLLTAVYYATTSGITSSNDGSHYALTRTMVENRAFALMQFDDYAEGNDIAIAPDGTWYSDRPPGTAVAAAVFYAAGRVLPAPPAVLPSKHDAANPALAYVMLLPVLAGAAAVALLYALMRELGVGRSAAVVAGLLFGLGTAHWKYSTVLFSHALSGFLIVLVVYLAILTVRRRRGWPWYAVMGLAAGYSVLVEYSNVLFVALVGLYLLWGLRPFVWRETAVRLGAFVLGGLPAALFLAYYNTVNFGAPFTTSYTYAVNYPWAAQFATTFSWPLLPGLVALLVWGEGGGWCNPTCYNQGLLLLSPVVLVALPGWVVYFRRERREAFLTTAVFLAYLLLFAKHYTSHGFTADGRYLVPFLGLTAVPTGFTLDWLLRPGQRPWLQAASWLAVSSLFFLSLRNMLVHIGTSYNYELALVEPGAYPFSPTTWRSLGDAILRNTANLPLLLAVNGVLLLVILLLVYWQRRRR